MLGEARLVDRTVVEHQIGLPPHEGAGIVVADDVEGNTGIRLLEFRQKRHHLSLEKARHGAEADAAAFKAAAAVQVFESLSH